MLNSDRRRTQRFPVQEIVSVSSAKDSFSAITRDMSKGGAYLYTDHLIAEGWDVQFILTVPSHVTHTQVIRVWCSGKVVRLETMVEGRFGMGVEFDRYQILPES